MHLSGPAFVLERRINVPLHRLNAALNRDPRSTAMPWPDRPRALRLDEPFRAVRDSWYPRWRATAALLDEHGRAATTVELEVGAWSADASRLQLRPTSRHPERWSRRRLRRYFALAHLAADQTASALGELTRTAPPLTAHRELAHV